MSAVGDRIKQRREALGLPLTAAAKDANVAKGYLWELEAGETVGRPSAEVLYRLAKTLETTMERLLGYQHLFHREVG